MKKVLCILFSCFSLLLFAQHAYVVFERTDIIGYQKLFGCGERFKVKLENGKKIVGRIDTVFADGMVLKADTVLFKDVKKFGYRFQSKRFLKNYTIISGTGTGLGAIFAIISVFESGSPGRADKGQTLAGAAAVFLLSAGPFFVDAVCRETGWQHVKMRKCYRMYGILRN